MSENIINNEWWGQLNHGGMLISPIVLNNTFPHLKELNSFKYDLLRDRYLKYKANMEQNSQKSIISEWIDYIFIKVLNYKEDSITKGSNISKEYKYNTILGKKLYPDRVISKNEKAVMLIKICEDKIIGVGKGKRNFAEFLELLRENKSVSLGVITNGEQIRLCYVDNENESWTEWNIDNWFVEEEYRNQLFGFITLLSEENTIDLKDNKSILVNAIEDSRKNQGELSNVLGEQVREAVEILISSYETTIKDNNFQIESHFNNNKHYYDAIYQAASRIIMRLVVIFFAESRRMLPVDIQAYNDSYGLEGLYEELKKACVHESRNELKNHYEAWRRILSLFKLVYSGSGHKLINLQAYGGELFKNGDINSEDDILKILSVFEHEEYKLNDYQVLEIIEKLKVGKVKVREGKRNIWVNGPVDFSQIRTEYIGIMYEGLLDYSLNKANDTMIVLNNGNQPILPLYHLESLSDSDIKKLYKGYKSDDAVDDTDIKNINEKTDILDEDYELSKAKRWALKVVKVLNLVNKNKIKDEYEYKKKCYIEADKLILHVYERDDYYLVKAGGIRKSTGTYYTKPGLTIPTVERTLQPLVYYKEDNLLIPKKPEDILALKICDPACGSGSFLVAATEYISNTLTESMLYYKRFEKKSSDKTRIMPYGTRSKGLVEEETLSVPPESEDFEEHLKARLMRYVVERCIYGVDINPMAVELARLSLWIETMNDELPFTFLDHKIKIGNSLVGTTLSNFKHYPIQAFEREGGDNDHNNGVKYKKKEWTKILKEYYKNIIKPEMVSIIESYQGIDQLEIVPKEIIQENGLDKIFEEVTELFEKFHSIPLSANGVRKREAIYKDEIVGNESILKLKFEFDKWCSIWFWPIDKIDLIPTPKSFNNISNETRNEIINIAKEQKFFHWELEFPDVFVSRQFGFDAIITNPPWNIAKPNSVEFFSYYDPLYSTYAKQKAIKQQKKLYEENKEIEVRWLRDNLNNKAMSNWVKHVNNPFGYDEIHNSLSLINRKSINEILHESWKLERDKDKINKRENNPFCLQGGSDINLYKLFIEESCYLINKNGRLGMIVPSGIYSDKGTKELRKHFLDNFNWEWLFSFENRNKIFDIDGRSKFAIIILNKGKNTEYVKTAFMVRDIKAWNQLNNTILKYYKDSIIKFSPDSFAFLEFENQRDIDIIQKMYNSSTNIKINTCTELHMTGDSKLFVTQNKLLEDGYKTNKFGIMKNSKGDRYVPLYQGIVIDQLNFFSKYWNCNNDNWDENKYRVISSQYYVQITNQYFSYDIKFLCRSISNSTNKRTFIGALTPGFPSGHSLTKIIFGNSKEDNIVVSGILSTFIYDYVLRNKMVGNNVSRFILQETPIVQLDNSIKKYMIILSSSLQFNHYIFSPQWLELKNKISSLNRNSIYKLWAITEHERVRLRSILEAIVAYSYGINYEDLSYILRDDESNAKGFWRVDKDKPKNVRLTTLALEAFKDLLNRGIEDFIKNEWQLPKEAQEYYGPRYLDWQLEKTAEESWNECEQYAREFLGEELFEEFMDNLKEKELK